MTSRLLAFALIGLVLLVFVAGIVMATSTHSGEQFAVDGFQRRSFSYYEMFGIRLSATDYFNNTGNLELTLAKKKWITATGQKPKDDQWITIEHTTGGRTFVSDVQILIDYLEMTSPQGAIDLAAWSTNNPGYAAIMWPEVQTAAQGNMFILVPDIIHHMLDLSQDSRNKWHRDKKAPKIEDLSKEELASFIAQQTKTGTDSLYPFLQDLYLEAAKAAQDANDKKRAKFCYEQVLRFSPGSAEIQAELDKFPAELTAEPAKEEAPDETKSSEDESEK
ncbi:hypothetical protein C5Y97_11465 [Blastopirellula marina]|uniref:Uncharacterized protein n=2 Tax=Blastopirellula marina TaxID=124 RepID=A0A2S8FWQ2_9BACT|nr:hypothetical protein C5Y98_11455 [Blastopirellula marina]PTL44435.1 hypothetical protein C5Y97_11465 [Blastopirellula marina]